MRTYTREDGTTFEIPTHQYHKLGQEGADIPAVEILEGKFNKLIFTISDIQFNEETSNVGYSYTVISKPDEVELDGFQEFTGDFVYALLLDLSAENENSIA